MMEIADKLMAELLKDKYLILTSEAHFAYNVTVITEK
jgi:hypothetical protein